MGQKGFSAVGSLFSDRLLGSCGSISLCGRCRIQLPGDQEAGGSEAAACAGRSTESTTGSVHLAVTAAPPNAPVPIRILRNACLRSVISLPLSESSESGGWSQPLFVLSFMNRHCWDQRGKVSTAETSVNMKVKIIPPGIDLSADDDSPLYITLV